MPRKKVAAVISLPPEVQWVRSAKGKVYYYWVPNRNTRQQGAREALPGDPMAKPTDTAFKAFWAAVEAKGSIDPQRPPGSVSRLVSEYRESEEFKSLGEGTQATYEVHMRRFENPEGWGLSPAKDLSPFAVKLLRDSIRGTPVMANQMVSVGRTIWAWGIPLGLLGKTPHNPFEHVKDLDIPDRGHVPWPEWARTYVIENAPADLVRLVKLGVMTCQRESDLVRMGPEQRDGNGIWCRPQKTRRKRRAFRVPLSTADAFELDRWAETPIRFENSRWKAPIERYRDDLYLYTPRAQPYTPDRLRARWGRWLNETPAGKQLCETWREWLAAQVRKYQWDIDPEDVRGPTIHGLRGAGVLVRLKAGYDADAVSNDIGMSLPMVQRYTRFRDQIDIAESARARMKVVERD
ncbi:hypothetical protein C7450_10398 [Chelatococcus asaccharovorans]|uniref:Phage integrase family protein n=2 Tax=Chelatococcus asaccharovorans TaxID=28210 RepID=A0A2V3UBK3_9HYPH|nr:hypothetical protein C7450_10398 [Chelatococcus asaccharovorans]